MHNSTLAQLFENCPELKKACQDTLSCGPKSEDEAFPQWWNAGTALSAQPAYNRIITLTFMQRIERSAPLRNAQACAFLSAIASLNVLAADFVVALRRAKLDTLAALLDAKMKM